MHDRRRQRDLAAEQHLLGCDFCAGLHRALPTADDPQTTRIAVVGDPDIVLARRAARELAVELGFGKADQTMIATAVSEAARNIVRFAAKGQIVIDRALDGPRQGVRVVARDAGPEIADVDAALRDGFSTNHGLGVGLPGIRRLMDEFDLVTEAGRGTTLTFTKWRSKGTQ